MRSLAMLTITAMLFVTPVFAYSRDEVAAIKQKLQHGVDHTDLAAVLEARSRFQALAGLEPKASLLAYWVAVADWRATGMLLNGPKPDRERAKRHCDAGIAAATRALELDPKFAGALAVKAGLTGLSTRFVDPASLISLGAQIEEDLSRAHALGRDDPRVSLFDGINALHKPAFVGGGPRPALARLERAIEQFGAEQVTDAAAPDWGRDDAYLWAGRASMQIEDYASARAYFTQALAVNPANGWVRSSLLPQAESALAAASPEKGKP